MVSRREEAEACRRAAVLVEIRWQRLAGLPVTAQSRPESVVNGWPGSRLAMLTESGVRTMADFGDLEIFDAPEYGEGHYALSISERETIMSRNPDAARDVDKVWGRRPSRWSRDAQVPHP